MKKHLLHLLILVLLLIPFASSASSCPVLKLWNVQEDPAFWRLHPDIDHEDVWYDPWGDTLTGIVETQSDVIELALYNDELQPFVDADIMADLSSSKLISAAVARMPLWLQETVTTKDGRILALPVSVLIRPFYWYPDAWAAAGLTADDVPSCYTELLDFLDAWVQRIQKVPQKNVCVSHLLRYNTGQEAYNYMNWLMRTLMISHEMQQRHAGQPITFCTPEFIALAERTRQTGNALYEAEPRQAKREGMLQLFQNDISGGEHANNGRPYGLSCSIPLRLTADQPKLTRASVSLVFIRKDSPWFNEGLLLLEHMQSSRAWWNQYALYQDFQPGDYPFDSERRGHVDAGWLQDYHSYDGAFVSYPRSLDVVRDGTTQKEALMMQFYQGKISAVTFAQGLDRLLP